MRRMMALPHSSPVFGTTKPFPHHFSLAADAFRHILQSNYHRNIFGPAAAHGCTKRPESEALIDGNALDVARDQKVRVAFFFCVFLDAPKESREHHALPLTGVDGKEPDLQ